MLVIIFASIDFFILAHLRLLKYSEAFYHFLVYLFNNDSIDGRNRLLNRHLACLTLNY
jgi:hypothetical protein